MKFLNVDIFQSVINFFETIKTSFSLEYLLYIFVGLEILTIIIFAFIAHGVYEMRLTRAVDKLNAYLYEVQYINESNLIEFNNMMKRVPKTLRYHWQQFMLNRDKAPSEYMSVVNCIDRPLKSSSFAANIKASKALSYIYAIFSFIFACGWASSLGSLGADFFIMVFAIPGIVLLLNYIFVMILELRRSNNTNELYQTFHIFNRFIDKAVSTMPSYVDFEVLFTEKEIRRGIPVLNEYIEKRQLQEQEEMKKARENAIQHELYDFKSAGEKGELVLERAMKETEIFVSMRNRLNTEIDQFEKEMDSLKRSFENTSKDYQKKLQASKENTERLREQQEATTNRIESNYIRKQQADEIKKQQQIEKDQDDAQLRFNQEINNLAAEIKKRKDELDVARLEVQKSMLAEYTTFSTKIYNEIRNVVNEKVKEEREELIGAREDVARELEEAISKIDTLEIQNKVLVNRAAQREAYIRSSVEKEKYELQQKLVEKQKALAEKDKQIQLISEDFSAKVVSKKSDKFDKQKDKQKSSIVDEEFKFDDVKPEEKEPDEFGGKYDGKGNYVYPNGSYYDSNGKFHDENGKIFDKEGVLIKEKQISEEEIENPVPQKIEITEDVVPPIEEVVAPKDEVTVEEVENKEEPVSFEEVGDFGGFDVEEPEDEVEIGGEPAEIEETEEDDRFETEDEESEVDEEEISEEEEKPEGKRRGRPRKEKIEEVKPEEKRQRGRPRKEKAEEVKPEEKRQRGRPKKEKIEEVKPEEKRQRGRPRKEEVVAEEKPEAKKRGRPKKEEEPKVEEKKQRGRPKKTENIDEDLKLIEKKIKAQNELLKKQQKALNQTVKTAGRPKKK